MNSPLHLIQVRIREQPVKKKKKGLAAKRWRRAGDEDEAEEEKQREERQKEGDGEDSEEEEEEQEPPEDPLATYSKLQLLEGVVELLRPGETVAGGLRRLGGLGKKKKGGRLRGEAADDKPQEEPADRNAEKLDRLTALADRLVGAGEYEIYQQSYEKLAYKVKSMSQGKGKGAQQAAKNGDGEEEDELDMFGDKFDEKHGEEKETTDNQDDSTTGGKRAVKHAEALMVYMIQCLLSLHV